MNTSLKSILGIVVLGLSSGIAQAASDNFNDGNDTANPAWSRVNPLGIAGYSFPGGNSYQISIGAAPNFPTFGPPRGGSVLADIYTTFFESVDVVNWNTANPGNITGLIARIAQEGPGTTDGYAMVFDNVGNLYLARITNEGSTTLNQAAFALNAANDYRLVFSGNGSSLTGAIYDLTNLATPLATVAATDATYASGRAGLLVFDGSNANQSVSATFDNYVAAVVPEPATASMLGLGLLGLVARRTRRQA
jgi:hypothetical protein